MERRIIMPTVLYPPTIDWNFLFQRPQQIMKQFAENGWKVYYINKTQCGKVKEEILSGLWVYHNFSILLDDLKEVDVLYISCPEHHKLVEKIKAKVVIYDYLDKFIQWDKYDSMMTEKADIVFATSQFLFEEKSKIHEEVYLIRNACDYDLFQKDIKRPQDMKELKRPVVGMVGALGKWINRRLLTKIAAKYTTVLIGTEFGVRVPVEVKHLGYKSYRILPSYYKYLDVGLIPFDYSETSKAANPIKMYEYLAAGIPVVGSDLPELNLYPDQIYTAKSEKEFIKKVTLAYKSDCPSLMAERKKIAQNNTWQKRFSKIEEILERFL